MNAYQRNNNSIDRKYVTISFKGEHLTINNQLYSYNSIVIQKNPQNSSYVLYLHDSTIIDCDDHEELQKFIRENETKKKFSGIKVFGTKIGVILPLILFTLLIMYISYKIFLPSISEKIAMSVSKEDAYSIGKDTLKEMDKLYFSTSKIAMKKQESIRTILLEKTQNIKELPKLNLQFRFSEKLGANAFSLPNGTIILLDDLVRLASNNDEILSIIAHEIGHIYHRHALRQLIQSSVLYFGLIFVTGDVTSLATLVGLLPVIIMQKGYSRDFERESDLYALNFMKKNNINPKNFATILTKISVANKSKNQDSNNSSDFNDYMRSHPSTKERIEIFLQ